MTIEQRIREALLPLGDPVQVEPFQPDKENKHPAFYYTIRISTVGRDNADNMPQHEVCYVLVHFICPLGWDSTERVAATKRALYAAGTTWPTKEDVSDSDTQDIVFECQTVMGVDV